MNVNLLQKNFVLNLEFNKMPMSDEEFQKKYSYYQKIGNENKLKTIWSDFSIDDLNSNFGFVDSIFYFSYDSCK